MLDALTSGALLLRKCKIGFLNLKESKNRFCFFSKQINPRSLKLRCIKGTEESTFRVDSLVPLLHHDP